MRLKEIYLRSTLCPVGGERIGWGTQEAFSIGNLATVAFCMLEVPLIDELVFDKFVNLVKVQHVLCRPGATI